MNKYPGNFHEPKTEFIPDTQQLEIPSSSAALSSAALSAGLRF